MGHQPTSAGTAPAGGRGGLERYAVSHPQFEATSGLPDLLRRAIDRAGAVGGPAVDLGCGEGGTLAAFRAELPMADLAFGVELSETRARRAHGRGLDAVLADAHRLPLRPRSVALAVSRHVIEHVDSDEVALAQIREALVPGGVLYLETPLRLAGAWYPYRNRAGRWVLDPTHVREYRSPAEVRALLAASGLTVDELEVGPIRFPVGHLVLRIPGATAAPGALTARLRDLRRPAVRVPRYREIRCLAVRR